MNEIEQIEHIFNLLKEWYKLPKYQLERRLDIYFALYLPEILEIKGINIEGYKNIFPEFPIKKEGETCASNNADYAILIKEHDKIKLNLVELKTDIKSIKKKNQIEYYKNNKSSEHILEGIIEILGGKTRYKEKYNYLLEKLSEFEIVEKDENGIWNIKNNKIYNDVEIIYIIPKETKKITEELSGVIDKENIITFDEIQTKLKRKKDKISQEFCEILSDIMLNK